jgi:hypothetical protein
LGLVLSSSPISTSNGVAKFGELSMPCSFSMTYEIRAE